MLNFLVNSNVIFRSSKAYVMLYSVVKSRCLMRNTIALSLNHHMTPEVVLKQSLLITVLVLVKFRRKD